MLNEGRAVNMPSPCVGFVEVVYRGLSVCAML